MLDVMFLYNWRGNNIGVARPEKLSQTESSVLPSNRSLNQASILRYIRISYNIIRVALYYYFTYRKL